MANPYYVPLFVTLLTCHNYIYNDQTPLHVRQIRPTPITLIRSPLLIPTLLTCLTRTAKPKRPLTINNHHRRITINQTQGRIANPLGIDIQPTTRADLFPVSTSEVQLPRLEVDGSGVGGVEGSLREAAF